MALRKSIIDYTANYISGLKNTHPASEAFGSKLFFNPDNEDDPENNIFLFRFPFSAENAPEEVMGDIIDVAATNRQGICIVPIPGGYPEAHSGQTYPAFVLRCKHEYAGRSFRTLMELIIELQDNARVFPQNGTIRSMTSQPGLVWVSGAYAHCYQAEFRSLVAEQIL